MTSEQRLSNFKRTRHSIVYGNIVKSVSSKSFILSRMLIQLTSSCINTAYSALQTINMTENAYSGFCKTINMAENVNNSL